MVCVCSHIYVHACVFSQAVLRGARAAVQQQYGTMREALEQEEQQALLCVSQEESRAVGGLEGQLTLLRDSLTSVQRGLHSLEGLADATGVARVQEQAFILVRLHSLTTLQHNDCEALCVCVCRSIY